MKNPEIIAARGKAFCIKAESMGYTVMGVFKNGLLPIKLKCNNGHTFSVAPYHMRGCAKCSRVCKVQAKESFLKRLTEKGIVLTGEYKDTRTRVEIMCEKGHKYKVIPSLFRKKSKCKFCPSDKAQKAKAEFIKNVKNANFELMGEYISSHTKTEIRCNNGHIFNMKPVRLRSAARCPVCSVGGFDLKRPGVFYVYLLTNKSGASVLGFGISNVFKTRHKVHLNTFSKNGVKWNLLATFFHENGRDAASIETMLKQHPDIIDFGVAGFKTECLPLKHKTLIFDLAIPKTPVQREFNFNFNNAIL